MLFSSKNPKTLKALNAQGLYLLEDLLWIFPKKIITVSKSPQPFSQMAPSTFFHGQGKMISLKSAPSFQASRPYKSPQKNITMTVQDCFTENTLLLKWFNSYPATIKSLERLGQLESFGLIGEISLYKNVKQIINPKIITSSGEDKRKNHILISYPTKKNVKGIHFLKLINKIPDHLWDNIPEGLPKNIVEKRDFLPLYQCFKLIHGKLENITSEQVARAKTRLIYEDFFNDQLKIYLKKKSYQEIPAHTMPVTEKRFKELKHYLPFALTRDQEKACQEIRTDLKSTKVMMRLLQGDVGCGKTAVALIAALIAIENGFQVAFMCPTEALAFQHFQSFKKNFLGKGIHLALLLGNTKANDKKEILNELKSGKVQMIIGTHTLIQKNTSFHQLGLAIIDEQHKFGVEQRAALTNKSSALHSLIMSATPIPRSLCLTQYGDLDITSIKEIPPGRRENHTKIIGPHNFSKFLSFIKTRVSMAEQIYIVVPTINESEHLDLHNVKKIQLFFEKLFPDYNMAGLHGKLKNDEKQLIFENFLEKKIDILIATSVIEVGINIINATVIAIMNPERFGLSSLHQLRGRVGRGHKQGFCFLVNEKAISQDGLKRLEIIEKNNNGFIIAEYDLKMRGGGDLFGTSQSGLLNEKKGANILLHQQEFMMALEDFQDQVNNYHSDLVPFIEEAAHLLHGRTII